MSTRHVKPPHPSFFFFSFFLPDPFFCSTAPQAFSRPDGVLSRPARADSVKAGRSSAATPPGLRPLQQSSTTAGLMGRVVLLLSVTLGLRGSARVIPITDVAYGRSCYEVHGACDVRINLYPAAPIRLAKVLLAWTIAQEGWDSSFERQIGKCRFAMQTHSHTSDPPDTPDWGCRNSAHCRRYRVRVAPCGTRPCSR